MAVTAVGAACWLALSFVSERDERSALRLVFTKGDLSPARIDDGLERARSARRLQPDAMPHLIEWALLTRRGRRRDALIVIERAVAAEPENPQLWLSLSRATRDPERAAEAQRRFRSLRPG